MSQDPAGANGIGTWVNEKNWDAHVDQLEEMAATPGFLALRDRLLAQAQAKPEEEVLDVGAGTGLLALAFAPLVRRVRALDISPAMCERLEQRAARLRLDNVETIVGSAHQLPVPDASIDLAVSNYVFHHLSDGDKRRALAEAYRALRPGGRLVFADMMFRVGLAAPRNRHVILGLVGRMLRRGPGGVVRIVKNLVRFLTGRWEHPADAAWWEGALREAGFVDVRVELLEHEGGIACARKPAPSDGAA